MRHSIRQTTSACTSSQAMKQTCGMAKICADRRWLTRCPSSPHWQEREPLLRPCVAFRLGPWFRHPSRCIAVFLICHLVMVHLMENIQDSCEANTSVRAVCALKCWRIACTGQCHRNNCNCYTRSCCLLGSWVIIMQFQKYHLMIKHAFASISWLLNLVCSCIMSSATSAALWQ